MMITLQRLNHQVVDRKPDRSAPVRVAAKQAGTRVPWRILDAIFPAVDGKHKGGFAMHFGKRSDAKWREKFILIQQMMEDTFELVARRHGQQPVRLHGFIERGQMRNVAGEFLSVFQKPMQPFRETWQPVDDFIPQDFNREQRDEADYRTDAQGELPPIDPELVV